MYTFLKSRVYTVNRTTHVIIHYNRIIITPNALTVNLFQNILDPLGMLFCNIFEIDDFHTTLYMYISSEKLFSGKQNVLIYV